MLPVGRRFGAAIWKLRATCAVGYAHPQGEYDVATAALATPVVLRHRPARTLSLLARSQITEDAHTELVALLIGEGLALGKVFAPKPEAGADPAVTLPHLGANRH